MTDRAMPRMKDLTKTAKRFLRGGRRAARKPIVNAIQFYDSEKLGFPLVEFHGEGQFQGISKGETVDGSCWPLSNGHKKFAKVYRVTSVRHTIETLADGSIRHLKSVFVVPVV